MERWRVKELGAVGMTCAPLLVVETLMERWRVKELGAGWE
jgi:hypothetical protein